MKNLVIGVIGNKGGIGKTTFSYNLLYLLTTLEIPSILIDCDNDQYSSADFAHDRKSAGLKPDLNVINMASKDLESNILKLSKEYEVIIIEFGKAVDGKEEDDRSNALKLAIKLSDKIVMPIQPSPVDAKTIAKIESKLSEIDCPAYIVPNRVKSQGQLDALLSAKDSLRYFKFTENYLKDLLCYQDSFGLDGRSVFELQKLKEYSNQNSVMVGINNFKKLFEEILCQEDH